MKLEHSFQVAAPLERVWEALIDVQRVAPCLPGAEITEAGEDGTYRGTFSVRLGPTTAAYRGELTMEEVDEPAHRAVMRATGQDKRGQGSAKATIVSTMRQEGDATTVEVETDFTITGRLARFGRGGMIQDVSNRLLRDFADCLQKTIEASGPAPPDAGTAGGPAAPEPGTPAAGTPVGASPTAAGPSPAAPPAPSAAARPRAKPVGGFSLFFRALLDRIRRALRRRR
jgi:carbon monoxide dehydrogenase subunit G